MAGLIIISNDGQSELWFGSRHVFGTFKIGMTLIRVQQEDVLRDEGGWDKNMEEIVTNEKILGVVYLVYGGKIECMSYERD